MKDFFQYRESLTEAAKARSKSAKIKYLEKTFNIFKSDFVRAGRNSTDIEIDGQTMKPYVSYPDKKNSGKHNPEIDWQKMAKEDFDLLDYIHDEFWRVYK